MNEWRHFVEERDRLVWLRDTGIACPQIIDWRETDDGVCVVMTAVPGISAERVVAKGICWPRGPRSCVSWGCSTHYPWSNALRRGTAEVASKIASSAHGDARTLHFFVDPTTLQSARV